MDFFTQLERYVPYDAQEAADRLVMLDCLQTHPHLYDRTDLLAHLSASAWIVNATRDKVLMIYHNIYKSWAWTGGHADGDRDLLAVALREAQEETGLLGVRPVSDALFSVETLTVNPHWKQGAYVTSHLHMNATYLLEADERAPLRIKADENSGVQWFPLDDAVMACTEPWMRPVYQKLNEKLKLL